MGEVFWHYYDQELTLARWEDPVYGLMPPALFIHVLEENLLIHKLDFDLCDILDEINQIVLAHEVPKDMIHVEIMESMRVLLAKERMLEGEKSHA